MEYIENEYVKLGVDLRIGGAVTVLIDKQRDERNLINSHDWASHERRQKTAAIALFRQLVANDTLDQREVVGHS